ncbi:O-methylsterigmatocystin oxidoreductase [Ceratobasidium theobromae]|uniref:O-methylsterigmatocystin oxidoreductase n=1 Tax=Ceratobasidium theobromae TaxID=1582974 RepID=A0A5N5QA80_9AGAM|nr:O-methylsterigmatocystin oxidoreductase [Ceratobasidium theobromae]
MGSLSIVVSVLVPRHLPNWMGILLSIPPSDKLEYPLPPESKRRMALTPGLHDTYLLGLLIVALGAVSLSRLSKRRKSPWRLPPSPKSDPLFGHIRFLPSVDEHIVYKQWSDELKSDIISLNMMGQIIIVLNSAEVANELLVKRSAIYADRPQMAMVRSERLTGWGNNTAFLSHGERWRQQRKMSHEVLHRKSTEELWPVIVKQSRLALQRLLDHPTECLAEFKRMAASSILSSAYGYEVTSADDDFLEIVEAANQGLISTALAGNFFVNVIPWLEYIPTWFPGAEWKRLANKWRTDKDKMLHTPFNWTKSQMTAGTAPPSMLKNLLTSLANKDIDLASLLKEEDHIRWTTGTMFSAGSDTSVAVLMVFVLAMTMHPEVQAKAQREIDAVLGGNRLPGMEDKISLPFTQCLIKEVLRWRQIVPLAIPHKCTQDNNYKGYHIPEGSMIIANSWAMSNDPRVYPRPGDFNPDRFLDSSVPEAPTFGYGRRGCPGVHFAEATLFITISTMLAVFDIRPICDEVGNPILPSGQMGPNLLVSHPAPFDCVISPRSKNHEQLLREWAEA